MGHCISMPLFNSKVKPNSEMKDISISPILMLQESSILISKEHAPRQMSRHILRRTEITSTGVVFKSMEDLLEEVHMQHMMLRRRR
ncbi:AC4 protein [Lycianthes yellow mosaic virus]|uniref:AC4 protein n=1 Tax=Lycianthes yellow mosaic virus TaxID=1779714 RepID=A0A140D6R2_9GEMI|nr:AC4 protein [Lycianthes yellow mosaic virus]AMK07578.1 AC4 protein [Lycianthes yellow mosaic virus]